MNSISKNIHSRSIQELKKKILKQRAVVIWITGLTASGKSTLAGALEQNLIEQGYLTQWLDGDKLREGLTKDLDFSEEGYLENIRRSAEVAKLFLDSNIITICTFISPTYSTREEARRIIGSHNFLEVYVNCPLEVCIQRDQKGLYRKALDGSVVNLSGVDLPYEAPLSPWLELHTHYHSQETCLRKTLEALIPRIKAS